MKQRFKDKLINDFYTLFPFSRVVIEENGTHDCVKVYITIKGENIGIRRDFYVEEFNESEFYRNEVEDILISQVQEIIKKTMIRLTHQI